MVATRIQIVFDCADPARLARFWAEALAYALQAPPEGYESWEDFLAARGVPQERWNEASALVDPEGTGARIYLQRVPESKTGKNRVHLDLNVTDRTASPQEQRRQVDVEVARLVGLGASVLSPGRQNEFGDYWTVVQDPEGNEFCVQ